jgi:phosphohistidine phosphatase
MVNRRHKQSRKVESRRRPERSMDRMIYLVRHGIAGPAPAGMSDSDRRLTAEGRRRMRRVALGLKRLGVAPDIILSSPLRRALETAAIVAPVLGNDLAIETYVPLAPGHVPTELLRGLGHYRKAQRLLLVGHQPSLGQLLSHLLTGSSALLAADLRKGGAAAVAVGRLPPQTAGELRWLLTAKQLRTVAAKRGG